jgi:[acyl-carrier-protein] S-malonyltransferase
MGRDLDAGLFERANQVLGRDLRRICWEGPAEVLTQTDNAQPGIFLASLVCLEALRARVPSLEFQATAGLSLGEFTALTAAGSLSFEDGLRVVQARGRFMQEACEATRGAMASIIGMDEAPLAEVCRAADADLANLNCPGQIVISGGREQVAKAVELAKARGARKAIPLQVAGAYHSRLMVGAREKLAGELAGVAFQPPRVTVVHNVTARPATEVKELLIRQVTGSVRWSDSMQWLIGQGFTRFIELGPGTVLTGLMKRINQDVQILNVADAASLETTGKELTR